MSHVWTVVVEWDCEPGVFLGVNATRPGAIGLAFSYMLGSFGCQYSVADVTDDRIEWRHRHHGSVIAERYEVGP